MTLAPFVVLLLLAGPGGASARSEGLASGDDWFRRTEQALMDAIGRGDRAPWERVADPTFVLTTQEARS